MYNDITISVTEFHLADLNIPQRKCYTKVARVAQLELEKVAHIRLKINL